MTARAKTGVDDPAALAPSTAVSYLLALFDYLRLRQIDATELQRSLNVDLNDRDARVSEHIPVFFDFSTGVRCCIDPTSSSSE